jgi:hypothetical protein
MLRRRDSIAYGFDLLMRIFDLILGSRVEGEALDRAQLLEPDFYVFLFLGFRSRMEIYDCDPASHEFPGEYGCNCAAYALAATHKV